MLFSVLFCTRTHVHLVYLWRFKHLTLFNFPLTFWYSFLPYLCSVQNKIVTYKKVIKSFKIVLTFKTCTIKKPGLSLYQQKETNIHYETNNNKTNGQNNS